MKVPLSMLACVQLNIGTHIGDQQRNKDYKHCMQVHNDKICMEDMESYTVVYCFSDWLISLN